MTAAAVDRFWSFVARDDTTTGCWLWTGGVSDSGYGQFKIAGRTYRAHRVSYLIANADLPDLHVCHSCDRPGCVRPTHLFVGTQQDNIDDKVAKGRQARGDRHGARLHPETRPRGALHGLNLHPERRARGIRNGNAHLADGTEDEIREKYATRKYRQVDLAAEYNICQSYVSAIVRNKARVRIG